MEGILPLITGGFSSALSYPYLVCSTNEQSSAYQADYDLCILKLYPLCISMLTLQALFRFHRDREENIEMYILEENPAALSGNPEKAGRRMT